jgi:hypothetical protein
MIELKKYHESDKSIWDSFLDKSRIDSFLFKRDFMDYHADRFEDFSFLIYRKSKLEALIPGNIANKTFYTHQGLTYGGLISSNKITIKDTLEIFAKLNALLKNDNIEEVIYKPTPHIYHLYPSEEDLYVLFKNDAEKIACNISSTIMQQNKIPFIESRKSGIRKALKEGVIVSESNELSEFWDILENNLKTHFGKTPVHSLTEIKKLKNCFPEQIKLYVALIDNNIVGGTLLFIMKNVVHVQYISANETGKNTGALDLLFHELINNFYVDFPIFDFGQSTEQNGNYLNEGLIFQKEGFGGRGVVYEVYKYNIK